MSTSQEAAVGAEEMDISAKRNTRRNAKRNTKKCVNGRLKQDQFNRSQGLSLSLNNWRG